jgi:hypothetical protein
VPATDFARRNVRHISQAAAFSFTSLLRVR